MSWALVDGQLDTYSVLALLTRGERSGMCGMQGLQPELGERVPVGNTCAERRLDSWHTFLDAMAELDTRLDTTPAMARHGPLGGPPFDLWVGSRSARVVFDLGDRTLTAESVVGAVESMRRAALPILPVREEQDIVAAGYYNVSDASAGYYGHPDHHAVHRAVFSHDFGLPGRQYGRTSRGDRDFLADGFLGRIRTHVYDGAMAIDPDSGQRLGRLQRIYGWLDWTDQGFPAGETDAEGIGFSQEQAFWLRF